MSLNRFEFIGRLTREPEIRETQTGKKVATIDLAQNKKWKNQAGEKQEKSIFMQFKAWGKSAEILEQYATKGMQIYIAAEVEPWVQEKEDGSKKYGHHFTIRDFEFLGSAKKNDGEKEDQRITAKDVNRTFPEGEEISIEDIPF